MGFSREMILVFLYSHDKKNRHVLERTWHISLLILRKKKRRIESAFFVFGRMKACSVKSLTFITYKAAICSVRILRKR